MNLQRPNANDATGTFNRSKNVVPGSGVCSRCIDGCKGNCEVFKATFRSREVIYPGKFGEITAGADKDYPVDYSHLNIQGYALGAKGLPDGLEGNPDNTKFPDVNTETGYGWNSKVKMKIPIFTGALGSTDVARKNWEHLAIGAASIPSLSWTVKAKSRAHRTWIGASKFIKDSMKTMVRYWYR